MIVVIYQSHGRLTKTHSRHSADGQALASSVPPPPTNENRIAMEEVAIRILPKYLSAKRL